jgi:protein TonB
MPIIKPPLPSPIVEKLVLPKTKPAPVKPVTKPVQATKTVISPPQAAPLSRALPASYVPPNATAAYLHNPKPFYPSQARQRGMEGVVVLAVRVSAQGRTETVSIKRSSGFALLDNAARKSVSKWRFVPAQQSGRAVAALVDIPIRYRLKDA